MAISDINASHKIKNFLEFDTHLNEIQDVDILLEEILTHARNVIQADAGSIYVVENNALTIYHAQNDTLKAKLPKGEKLIYRYFVPLIIVMKVYQKQEMVT